MKNNKVVSLAVIIALGSLFACKPKNAGNAISGDAAAKAYVAPGKYDEFYNFVKWLFTDYHQEDCCVLYLFSLSILKKDMVILKNQSLC